MKFLILMCLILCTGVAILIGPSLLIHKYFPEDRELIAALLFVIGMIMVATGVFSLMTLPKI